MSADPEAIGLGGTGLSWEPDWDLPVAREHLRHLVDELHVVLVQRHFARRAVYGSHTAGLAIPDDRHDDLAVWTRYTENGYVEHMMNGVACFGNGLIRVSLDQGQELQLLAQESASPDPVAFCVAGFIDRTDDRCRTKVLRAP